MIDLSTNYLGKKLRSPLVASSSPLCKDVANLQRMEEAGAAAVVLDSLFEEQILWESQSLDRALNAGSESYAEALSYFPDLSSYGAGPRAYLQHVRAAKKKLSIPVIGSLNGVSRSGWERRGRMHWSSIFISFRPTSTARAVKLKTSTANWSRVSKREFAFRWR
jgi:dihydroorotate dehydrogenase (fumarate)